jgi:para-nitrobenzyl esterase
MISPPLLLLTIGLGVVADAAHPPASQAPPQVRIAAGPISGVRTATGFAYLGIPYAAPPTGENRWREPKPVHPWKEVRATNHFSTSCFQALEPNGRPPFTHEYQPQEQTSEDCLYLNVWTPTNARGARLPVLFWIPGGAFSGGSGAVPIYNGTALAAHRVVVVTINYRVGVFGFMAHSELSLESAHHVSGNYGLLDILAALRWLKRDIRAFGGDPDQVTIAGQSAGAAAVMLLLQMQPARHLFKGAIAESGPALLPAPFHSLHAAEADGSAVAKRVGAHGLADLRALPAAQLAQTLPGSLRFTPNLDGWLVHDDTPDGSEHPAVNDVPILAGMNANEAGPASPLGTVHGRRVAATAANYAAKVHRDYGDSAENILHFYPVADDSQTLVVARRLARDRGLAAVTLWAKDHSRNNRSPLYCYLYNYAEPGATSAADGAFHTSEVPYIFQTLDAAPERGFTAADRRFSEKMAEYWTNFVKHGNPNDRELRHWPAFKPSDPKFMVLDPAFEARDVLDSVRLDLFEGYVRRGGRISVL